jgi:two-component system, NarL family, invasion response regulator UvrY
MIHVIIADDHPLMREGIKKVLQNEIDIDVVGEAENFFQLFDILSNSSPDILVLDFTMPGKSGITLIKDLSCLYPHLPVLVLSMHPVERFGVRAIKAGAKGYLSKSVVSNSLVTALRKIVIEKRKYITPELAEHLAYKVENGGKSVHELLSDRELETLCLIASGKSIHSIAEKLAISVHTVHTYRSRIKEKLNLNTNVDMALYAIENRLIHCSLLE